MLEQLKQDLEYMMIPVIMLTSSNNEADIARSYKAHAASYIQKPIGYEEFIKLINIFTNYWSTVNSPPQNSSQ